MVGKENGVAVKLKREVKMLLDVHCICHRLALACGDANDHISYIKTVEKVLIDYVLSSTTRESAQQHTPSSYYFSRVTDFTFCKEKGCKAR